MRTSNAGHQPLHDANQIGRGLAVFSALAVLVALLVGAPTTASADAPAAIGTVTRFTEGVGRFPMDVVAGPDGNMWVAGFGIQRVTATGEVTTFDTSPVAYDPLRIATGSDGNLWFTTMSAGIGRMTPAGVVTIFPVALTPLNHEGSAQFWSIVSGPDGNLWFTMPNHNHIGRITTAGVVTLFSSDEFDGTMALTVGPGGRLWFGTSDSVDDPMSIGSIDPSTGHIEVLDAAALGAQGLVAPLALTMGADGNLWGADVNAIDRITPAGVVTRFPTGTSKASWDITTGADGNVWFSPFDSNRVVRVTPAGVMTWFGSVDDATPHSNWINGIGTGPNGTVWFTNQGFPSSSESPNATVSRVVTGSLPTCDAAPFADVPVDHPFCGQIQWMVDGGITTGFPDDTFRPAEIMSRQAAAAFLYRAAGSPDGDDPTCSAAPFLDVPIDHPFCGEIAWAASEGIADGYPGGRFVPGDPISRQAMAAFFYRFAGEPNGVDPTCDVGPFTDVWAEHWLCGEIDWMTQRGITNGYPDGSFGTFDPVSRQAMAAFLYRLENPI